MLEIEDLLPFNGRVQLGLKVLHHYQSRTGAHTQMNMGYEPWYTLSSKEHTLRSDADGEKPPPREPFTHYVT